MQDPQKKSGSPRADAPVAASYLPPHPMLSEWVSHYWQIEGHCPSGEPRSFQRLLPGLNAAFIVQLAAPVDVQAPDGTWQSRPRAFAEGHFHRPFHLRFADQFRLVGISFAPGRIHSFLKDSQAHINDRFVDLSDVLAVEGALLAERLHLLSTFPQVAAVFDQLLLSRLPSPDHRNRGLHQAMNLATRQPFATSVQHMAKTACLSPRQLERRFQDTVGLSPKYFCRVARFDRFVRRWGLKPDHLLTALAQECGYFDQAHLNREFKRFTHESPTSYLARDHAVAKALNRLHVEVQNVAPAAVTLGRRL